MRWYALLILAAGGFSPRVAAAGEQPTQCRLEFKSDAPKQLLEKIQRLLSRSGGQAGQIREWSKKDPLLGTIHTFVQDFDLPPRKTQELAKSLTALAPLNEFSCSSRPSNSGTNQLNSINKSIASLEAESKANAAALARMPITHALLRLNLGILYSARKSIQVADRSVISVTALDTH